MSETARLLETSLGRVLDGHADGEEVVGGALWRTLDALGLPALLVPEADGGAGATLVEAHAGVAALAARGVGLPVGECLIARGIAARAGLSLEGPASFGADPRRPAVVARPRDGGWRLDGTLGDLPWAAECPRVLIPVKTPDGPAVAALGGVGNRLAVRRTVADEPRATLTLEGHAIDAADLRPLDHPDTLLDAGAALRAVQIGAALGAALDLAVGYTRERQQFGRPLARFQAVQQQLATLASETTLAQVAARRAFLALHDPGGAGVAVAAAKICAGEAATRGAATVHQVHGAMGFTREYPLHRLTRRLWSWREDFGSERWWSERLAARALEAGADDLWAGVIVGR